MFDRDVTTENSASRPPRRKTADEIAWDNRKLNQIYFEGCDEYLLALYQPRVQIVYKDIDESSHEFRLGLHEFWILEKARVRAGEALKKTGICPRLKDDFEYREFLAEYFPAELDMG